MGDVELVHPIPVEECPAWAATLATTFFGDPHGERFQRNTESRLRNWRPERRWGARAGGRWVATLATLETQVTVPGGQVPADGLTSVTVAATHRRRGLLTALVTDSLQAARERGDVVSILIAAEWPIYGRYGYAPAEVAARYTLYPRRGGVLPPAEHGQVRQVEAGELGELAAPVFDRARLLRAGNIERRQPWWDSTLGLHGVAPSRSVGEPTPTYVVHEGPDGVDGFAWWSPKHDFDLDGSLATVTVGDLQAATDDAYRGLWAYLSGIDAVGELKLDERPVDEPVRWLLPDGRALRQTYAGDGLWLRLLDVPAALAARHYARADRLVLEVVDDAPGGYAAGRYLLGAGPDGASCTRAGAHGADLRIAQPALASAYLGGFSLRQQQLRGMVDELTPGALDRLDAMLATPLAPWSATSF